MRSRLRGKQQQSSIRVLVAILVKAKSVPFAARECELVQLCPFLEPAVQCNSYV